MHQSALGQIIRDRRLALSLTQEELVGRIAASDPWIRQADISRIENGQIRIPRIERLQAIAEALGLSLGDLLFFANGVDEEGQLLIDTTALEERENPASGSADSATVWDGSNLPDTLLDLLQQAVIVTDPAGKIRYWNAYAEALYGWTADEVRGCPVGEVTVAETWEWQEQAAAIMQQLTAGQRWSGQFTVRRRDGATFIAQVTLAPVRDEQDEIIAIFGTSYAAAGARIMANG